MKITILNGNSDAGNMAFDEYLGRLDALLTSERHHVVRITLRDLDLRSCVGCFGCWLKTPGECVTPDDGPQVRRAMINSDFILWASPLKMGFLSALLKMMLDKSIPLIHPYVTIDHNEIHHLPRYARYPKMGLLLQKECETDEEDIHITSDIFSRTSLNFKSSLAFTMLTDQPVEALAHAITNPPANPVRFDERMAPTRGVRVEPPTHLTLFNGSPRGQKGGTPLLLEHFLEGFTSLPGRTYEIYHLSHARDADRFFQAFAEAECVLLGFPLYTDAMPGIVKTFIESLAPLRERPNNPPMGFRNPPIGFLVQSGFPEAIHSRHVERYLEKLALRMGSPYVGTILKGGVEGIRTSSEDRNRPLFQAMTEIGKRFSETGQFDPFLLRNLAKPERFPAIAAPLIKLMMQMPQASSGWDSEMKENGVFTSSGLLSPTFRTDLE